MQTARHLVAIACLLVAMLGSSGAQIVAGPHRPASVPQGFLVTPFGYFHPSCVVRLAPGDELRHDTQTILHKDGTATAMTSCLYSHFKENGEAVFGDERAVDPLNIGHAYVELVSVTTKSSYGSLTAQWTVPPAPASDDGQTLYYFPGLEDANDVVTILQPVLGWNSDYASAWGIASWNCCERGTTYEAPPAHVSSGDGILGTMSESCDPGTRSCKSWNIVTQDLQNGATSSLLNTSNFKQTFNWAFGGALEVYGITQCSDYATTSAYPGGNTLSFNNVILTNNKFVQIANPAWKISPPPTGVSPQCNYGASLGRQVILNN